MQTNGGIGGVIDVWAQHPTPEFLTKPIFSSLNRWNKKSGGGAFQQRPQQQLLDMVCSTEFTIQQMDSCGVEKALTCAWYDRSGSPWISNEQVLQFASQHPTRLFPILSHSFLSPLLALQELRTYFDPFYPSSSSIPSSPPSFPKPLGIRIIPWLLQTTIDDARFYPVFAYMCEKKIPLFIQVGWTGPMVSSEYGRPIPYLERVLSHFPDLIVICGHIGQPWLDEVMFLTSKFENVYIDTSAYKPSRFPPALINFIKSTRGRKKVMFGTNYPMLSFKEGLGGKGGVMGGGKEEEKELGEGGGLKGLGFDEETLYLYLKGNAERVLFSSFFVKKISKL